MLDPIQDESFPSDLPEDPALDATGLGMAADPVEAFLEAREIGQDFQVPGGVIRVETRIKVSRSPWSVRSVVLENSVEIQEGPFAPIREELDASKADPEALDDLRISFAQQALDGHYARCRQVERTLAKAQRGGKQKAETGGKSSTKGILIAVVAVGVIALVGGTAYLLGPGKKLFSGMQSGKGKPAPAAPVPPQTTPAAAEPTPAPGPQPAPLVIPAPQAPVQANEPTLTPVLPAPRPAAPAPRPAPRQSTRPAPATPREPVVRAAPTPPARDLIRIAEPTRYTLGKLKTGEPAYIDDGASFAEVPSSLQNVRCIRPANDDRAQNLLLSFNVRQNARIYVAHDRRIRKKPDWLQPFSRTSQAIAVTEAGGKRVAYDVFVRDVAAGPVVLGSNTQWTGLTRKLRDRFPKDIKMYLVCVESQPQ